MREILPFLKKLISLPGLSGYETPVRSFLEESWRPLVDEISLSRLGSLHALKRGKGREPRPSVLIAAHMDAIGFMVSGITGEFLRLTEIGDSDRRALPGQAVIVHGQKDLPGVIVSPPAHLLPPTQQGGPVESDYLLVDLGLTEQEFRQQVRPGDLISYAQAPIELPGEFLVGHSLDNRASVAALTHCLEVLQNRHFEWDIWAVATSQEEETYAGASTSAFQIRPSLAVVVDVTFGAGPGSPNHNTYPLGKGPSLGWGPVIHPALFQSFKEIADCLEIPFQVEIIPHYSNTDADSMQLVAEGIPTILIGIPLRYMHTPVEMVCMKDIYHTGQLLAEFCANLEVDYLDKFSWVD